MQSTANVRANHASTTGTFYQSQNKRATQKYVHVIKIDYIYILNNKTVSSSRHGGHNRNSFKWQYMYMAQQLRSSTVKTIIRHDGWAVDLFTDFVRQWVRFMILSSATVVVVIFTRSCHLLTKLSSLLCSQHHHHCHCHMIGWYENRISDWKSKKIYTSKTVSNASLTKWVMTYYFCKVRFYTSFINRLIQLSICHHWLVANTDEPCIITCGFCIFALVQEHERVKLLKCSTFYLLSKYKCVKFFVVYTAVDPIKYNETKPTLTRRLDWSLLRSLWRHLVCKQAKQPWLQEFEQQ